MGLQIKRLSITLMTLLLFPAFTFAQTPSPPDVTNKLEDLGIPSKKAAYAKNIWDLQLWNNKIYIGTGNSSNSPPNSNAGPIPIISYTPSTNQFTEEPITLTDGTVKPAVDEEQIAVFRDVDGVLTIPGHDSRESWALGNFYRLESTGWKKYRTIPNGIHVFDIISYQGKWYAGLGTDGTQPSALVSTDLGLTWHPLTINNLTAFGRIYNFYVINGKLIITSYLGLGLSIYDGINGFSDPNESTFDTMFPGYTGLLYHNINPYDARFERALTFNNNFVYIGADGINDQQWEPHGLYKSAQVGSATKITLPTNATPWDIVVRGNTLYVLGDIKTDATHHIVTVDKTSDLTNWTEILRFNADTFARSFEELNGYFYFGLGSDTTTIPADTGKLFRVQYTATPSPTLTRKPGDTNGDNKVDGLDYVVWLNNYGKIVSGVSNGDFNSDNKVDGLDYVIWLNGYGK